jgi:hypothetical protein
MALLHEDWKAWHSGRLDPYLIIVGSQALPKSANPWKNQDDSGGHMSEHEKEAILSRIERLEAQNRRLKKGAMVCLVAVAGVGLMGQTQHKSAHTPPSTPPAPVVLPKNIEAESFLLKDPAGHVRAELAMAGTGPSFKLRDQNGSALVTISLNDSAPGGPFVLLSDPQHHAGLTMSALEGAGSQLSLTGERPEIQARIAVAPDGTSLQVSDQDGFSANIGNGVQANKSGQVKKTTAASITLFNKDRKVLWSAP